MKFRVPRILTITVTFFCFALAQAFGQAQTPTPTSSDPDNVEVQQDGQFGPGSTIDEAGAEPNEINGEQEGLEAETPDTTPQSVSISLPNSSVAQQHRDANANMDVEEALGADLNEP